MQKRTARSLAIATALTIGLFSASTFAMLEKPAQAGLPKEIKQASKEVINQYKNIKESAAGIEEYKSFLKKQNAALMAKKADHIEATVTFAEPLTLEQVKTYLKDYNIQPTQFVARSLNGEERITTAFKPKGLEKFDEVVQKLAEKDNAVFVGFIDMAGYVSYEQLAAMEADALTFTVDASADNALVGGDKGAFPVSLSWMLEDVSKKEVIQGYKKNK